MRVEFPRVNSGVNGGKWAFFAYPPPLHVSAIGSKKPETPINLRNYDV